MTAPPPPPPPPQTLAEIRSAHPGPWKTTLAGNGLVMVVDAAGRQVPLFTLTRLAELVSVGFVPATQPHPS